LGILSLLILLQALTQAGVSRSTHPSQRLKSMSVDNGLSDPACAVVGILIPVKAATPAVICKKDRRLILEILVDCITSPLGHANESIEGILKIINVFVRINGSFFNTAPHVGLDDDNTRFLHGRRRSIQLGKHVGTGRFLFNHSLKPTDLPLNSP
jgi:hypothetical protein